jgi:NAD(P)H-hydrate epimerase
MRVVNQKEMKEIETASIEQYALDEALIIENVGINAAQFIASFIDKEKVADKEIIVLIGPGNNGADGLSIARNLKNLGFNLRAFLLFAENDCSLELLKQLKMARAFGVRCNQLTSLDQLQAYLAHGQEGCLFIDAIFGTGVRLPLSHLIYDIIHYVNDTSLFTFSVDMPTGVNGDSGFIQGNAIRADVTLAIGLPKIGYYIADGAKYVGEIELVDAGFPQSELSQGGNKFLLDFPYLIKKINSRNKFADKKTFGHTLVIGGSHGLTGALVLASQAALKVGAGLVTGVTWENQYQEFISRLIPEIMTGYIPMDQNKWTNLIKNLNERYDAIVIGPGLARSARARKIVLEIMHNYRGPLVIDADAINVLSLKEDQKAFSLRDAPTVLTPHFGEFARFCNLTTDELERAPITYLSKLVESINCTVVLKGPCTYLGSPSGKVFINYFPNDGMATGGAGDVLAGILGGLLGQDQSLKEKNSLYTVYENFDQVVGLAVLIHSISGGFAAQGVGGRSMTATSLIEHLAKAFNLVDDKIQEFNQG